MNFTEIAENRQSCRKFDASRSVEKDKIDAIINSAILSPSACNGQPYHFTVCTGEAAKKVAKATQVMGMNKFADDAPLFIVISEEPYVISAALGAKLKGYDFRSIDIGIASAYITAEASAQGLGSCILGLLDDRKLREICGVSSEVRLVIAIGYPRLDDKLREKKRKSVSEIATFIE